MIERFTTGPARILWYIYSTPTLLATTVVVLVLLLIAAIYPGAVYVYPQWKGTDNYVDLYPFGQEIKDIDVRVVAPSRLIPNRDNYVLRVETTNLASSGSGTRHVFLSVNKDQTYVHFEETDTLPITWYHQVPPETTVVKELPFKVLSVTQGRPPVKFSIEAESSGKQVISSFKLSLDYLSVPVVAIVAFVAPALVAAAGLVLKLVTNHTDQT